MKTFGLITRRPNLKWLPKSLFSLYLYFSVAHISPFATPMYSIENQWKFCKRRFFEFSLLLINNSRLVVLITLASVYKRKIIVANARNCIFNYISGIKHDIKELQVAEPMFSRWRELRYFRYCPIHIYSLNRRNYYIGLQKWLSLEYRVVSLMFNGILELMFTFCVNDISQFCLCPILCPAAST